MKERLFESVSHVCLVFNKFKVEYLLIGGTAVAVHGYFRLTVGSDGKISDKLDLDIWFNPTLSNYYRLLDALLELNYDVSYLKNEIAKPRESFIKLDFDNFKLDLLPEIPGVDSFNTAYENRDITEVNKVQISVISLVDLKKSKSTTNRQKDKDDLEHL